ARVRSHGAAPRVCTTWVGTSAPRALVSPFFSKRLVEKLFHIGPAIAEVPCRLLPVQLEPGPVRAHQLQTRPLGMTPQLTGRVPQVDIRGQARPLDNAGRNATHGLARGAIDDELTPVDSATVLFLHLPLGIGRGCRRRRGGWTEPLLQDRPPAVHRPSFPVRAAQPGALPQTAQSGRLRPLPTWGGDTPSRSSSRQL